LALKIPSIGVQSTLLQLGLNPDKSIEVPPLDDPDSKAGWYKYSPTPGQVGPTVILGHVDSAKYGPGIFFRLGALQPGATVEVTLTDRIVAVFTVDKVVAYPKSAFLSTAVYGNIDHPRSTADHLRRNLRPGRRKLRKQHRRLRHPDRPPPDRPRPKQDQRYRGVIGMIRPQQAS